MHPGVFVSRGHFMNAVNVREEKEAVGVCLKQNIYKKSRGRDIHYAVINIISVNRARCEFLCACLLGPTEANFKHSLNNVPHLSLECINHVE